MHENPTKTSKIAVIIGGFLIIVGAVMLGIFALALFRILSPDLLANEDFATVFMSVLAVLGILDLISGLVLLLR